MEVLTLTFNPFQENTYLVYDETKQCIIIDPGCEEKEEKDYIVEKIDQLGLKPQMIVNTHCHVDHVLGVDYLQNYFKIPFFIHPNEEPLLKAVKSYASNYGFYQYKEPEVTGFYTEKDNIKFGKSQLDIIFVPGHSPGHIAFIDPQKTFCINGDVLFNGSIGRTDLPGGDYQTLINSIHTKLFNLPDNTVIYCGHGPQTTINKEKMSNPYCGLNV